MFLMLKLYSKETVQPRPLCVKFSNSRLFKLGNIGKLEKKLLKNLGFRGKWNTLVGLNIKEYWGSDYRYTFAGASYQ